MNAVRLSKEVPSAIRKASSGCMSTRKSYRTTSANLPFRLHNEIGAFTLFLIVNGYAISRILEIGKPNILLSKNRMCSTSWRYIYCLKSFREEIHNLVCTKNYHLQYKFNLFREYSPSKRSES